MTDTVKLTEASREISKLLDGKAQAPSYRELYGKILDGRLEAEKRHGRYEITRPVLEAEAKQAMRRGSRGS